MTFDSRYAFVQTNLRSEFLSQAELGRDTMFRAQETGGVFKISDLVPVERKLRELLLDLAGIQTRCLIPNFAAALIVVFRKSVFPCSGCSPADDIISPPVMVMRSAPVSLSSSRQISYERSANGTNCSPSPIACRVIRVSPYEDPNECGGAYLSIPITLAPPPAMAACVPAFSIYKAFSYGSFNRRAGRFAFFRFLKPCSSGRIGYRVFIPVLSLNRRKMSSHYLRPLVVYFVV